MSLVDQLPALIGVAVVTGGTIVATGLSDRARWRRGQSVRWDERRLDAYTEYARTVKEIHLLAFRIAAAGGLPPGVPGASARPLDRDTGLDLLAQAGAARSKAWETVLLLGDAATVAAARRWRLAVRQLEHVAIGRAEPEVTWLAALKEADLARDGYYAAARDSLLVGGGSVAQVPWLTYPGQE